MGKWSFHPMGNDDALNIRDLFFDVVLSKDIDIHEDRKSVKEALEKLTANDVDKFMKEKQSWFMDNTYDYVMAYVYADYEAFDISDNLKEKLKQCLRDSIDAFCNPFLKWRFPKHVLYRNLLSSHVPQDSHFYTLYCLEIFLDKFDDVFAKRFDLEKDIGLIEKMSESSKTNSNYSDEEKAFLNVKFCYTEGWSTTLGYLGDSFKDLNKRRDFYLRLARNGDICAQMVLLFEWSKPNHINEVTSLEILSLLFNTLNSGVFTNEELYRELDEFLSVDLYGYYLYKKILSEIYSFIIKNKRNDLLDTFISLCHSYQNYEKIYFKSDDVPGFYQKKDQTSLYNFLTLDFYFKEEKCLVEYVPLTLDQKFNVYLPKSYMAHPVKTLFYSLDANGLEGIDTLYIPNTLEVIGDREEALDDELINDHKISFSTDSINNLVVEDNNPSIKEVDGLFYSSDMKRLLFCPKNKFKDVVVNDSVTSIDFNVFWLHSELDSISIGRGVKDLDGVMLLSCGDLKVIYKGTREEFLSIAGIGHDYISISEYPEYENNKVIISCTDGDINYVDWLKN